MEENFVEGGQNPSLEIIISKAIQVPGVRVSRDTFLADTFKKEPRDFRNHIIEVGPIEAGCDREELQKIAKSLIRNHTLVSSGTSFMAGLPGGPMMAAAIPIDTLQFFAIALRLAQEIAYLYGAENLWTGGAVDMERVQNQLILYCGVMFGASGANATVKLLSSTFAKQALKKLPQQALTKTFYYPIIKSIAKAVGAKMTKEVFAKGVSKAIPIVGGAVSGGITYISMGPMGRRLARALDEANFAYSQEEIHADIEELVASSKESEAAPEATVVPTKRKSLFLRFKKKEETISASGDMQTMSHKEFLETLASYKQLEEEGVLSPDEFQAIKAKLLKDMGISLRIPQ